MLSLLAGVGFEAVGDRAQCLGEHEHDNLGGAAGPAHPLRDRGGSVSDELEHAGGEVPGEGDLLWCWRLGGVVRGARTVVQ